MIGNAGLLGLGIIITGVGIIVAGASGLAAYVDHKDIVVNSTEIQRLDELAEKIRC